MKSLLLGMGLAISGIIAVSQAKAAVHVTNFTPLQYHVQLSDGSSMGVAANIGMTTSSPAVLGPFWWANVGPYEAVMVSSGFTSNASVGIYSPMTTTYKVNAFSPDGGVNVYITITP